MDRWCQFQFRDFGFSNPGVHGFGAVLFNQRHPYEDRFLVEHNLAALWDKQYLLGVSPPLPTLLLQSRQMSGCLSRLPVHLRHDLPHSHLENRNLLATKRLENFVKLWTVSEQSDRKLLEEYSLTVRPDGSCEILEERRSFPLHDLALQLKRSQLVDIVVRRRGALEFWNDGVGEIVFRGAVNSYEESPFLAEILICDKRGFVWHGPPGMPFSRIKNYSGRVVKHVCFSDHPRVVFASSGKEIRLLDLRTDIEATAISLFSLSEFDSKKENEQRSIPHGVFEHPQFVHLLEVPTSQRYCLAISNRYAYIIDSRWTGRAVTSIAHGLQAGGDYVLSELPFKDPEEEGTIHHFHFLNHTPPTIKTLSLYRHSCGHWSTLGPLKKRSEPADYCDIFKEHAHRKNFSVFSPTRAISAVEGLEDCRGRRMDIFFRALDDGSLWSEKILFEKLDLEENNQMIQDSIMTMKEYVVEKKEEPHMWTEDIPNELIEDERRSCRLINFEVDVDETEALSWEKEVRPMKMKTDKTYDTFSVEIIEDEKKQISRLVSDMWKLYLLPTAKAFDLEPIILDFEND